MSQDEKRLEAWVIGAAGRDCQRVFEAPVEIPDWEQRPWVKLRPLTAHESLQRESCGIYDEYALDSEGTIERVVRRYDRAATTRYDYAHCLVDFCLPRQNAEGQTVCWQPADESEIEADCLLQTLPPALAEWLETALDEVNMRRVVDQQLLSVVKKS